jgi:hypothetical protein
VNRILDKIVSSKAPLKMAKMADVEMSGVGLERSDSQGEESYDSLLQKFLNEVQKFLQTQSQKDLRIFKEFLEKMLREKQEYAEKREREHQKRMEEIHKEREERRIQELKLAEEKVAENQELPWEEGMNLVTQRTNEQLNKDISNKFEELRFAVRDLRQELRKCNGELEQGIVEGEQQVGSEIDKQDDELEQKDMHQGTENKQDDELEQKDMYQETEKVQTKEQVGVIQEIVEINQVDDSSQEEQEVEQGQGKLDQEEICEKPRVGKEGKEQEDKLKQLVIYKETEITQIDQQVQESQESGKNNKVEIVQEIETVEVIEDIIKEEFKNISEVSRQLGEREGSYEQQIKIDVRPRKCQSSKCKFHMEIGQLPGSFSGPMPFA